MEATEELLFLVHRIPYPPDKGDKIRSFHELEYLSRRFRVHLGTFVDNAEDWRHAERLGELCASTCLLPLTRWRARLRSLRGLWSGEALTLPFYRDRRMRDWVTGIVSQRPLSSILVFSSAMAPYVADLQGPRRLLDFVDVDSDKWRQYSRSRRWPASWLYRREADRLLAFERAMARRFDRSLFVSESEALLFARLAPESAARLGVLKNGVDASYFLDTAHYPDPYPQGRRILVFTGAMDYWPNIDAVTWFADEIFPLIRAICPDAWFYIVGSRPDKRVLALRQRPGICVTGKVEDVRPYLAHASLVVAPLRVARGVQNKVLEAMAMDKPLLATPQAMEGIEVIHDLALAITDTREDWVRGAIAALAAGAGRCTLNRRFVVEHYDWRHNLADLEKFLNE